MQAIAPLSLYSISGELRALEEALLESGGEITPEMEERFADLLDMEQSKLEGYLRMIRKYEATAEAIQAEEKRLAAARKTMENAASSLKARMLQCMRMRGIDEHQTAIGKIKVLKSSSVPVVLKVEAEQLPAHFRRVTVSADLTALRHALKEGAATDLAEFGEASYFIRIY